MNIQDAVKESLKTNKAISRENLQVAFIPKNNLYPTIIIVDLDGKRLPGKGWQPTYEDLIADDWYVIDKNYQNLIEDI